MRISKFYIKAEQTKQLGLKEIDLTEHPLGSVVALAGKNGAGKSRVLQFVEAYIQNITLNRIMENQFCFIPEEIIPTVITTKSVGTSQENVDKTLAKFNKFQEFIAAGNIELFEKFRDNCQLYLKIIDNDSLKLIGQELNEKTDLTFEHIIKNSNLLNNKFVLNNTSDKTNKPIKQKLLSEFDVFKTPSTFEFIKSIANEIIDAKIELFLEDNTQPDILQQKLAESESFKRFNKFQEFVQLFLGKAFSYKQKKNGRIIDSILHFNNRPFELKELSPGQKTLFAYAVLLFYLELNSKSNIKESILVIDEPEKHLHPEAQIKLIDTLKDIIKDKGQLWIATHSVHILSHLNQDEIFLVKDDEIIKPSRLTPGHSLNELMGLDTHINELSDFITSTSEWAYANFMKQCFVAPESVFSDNLKDKQYVLFKEWISAKDNIELLDYGAGKGRLGHLINLDPELKGKIQYSAFDIDPNVKGELEKIPNIVSVFNNAQYLNPENYDCVVLCNVLHEIAPDFWIELFESIMLILKPNGKLLIIEDKFLPKGERAHDYGYLILAEKELSALFNIRQQDFFFCSDNSTENDRILFAAISRNLISVTSQGIISALSELEKNSYKQLKELRKDKSGDARIGRLYANQCQLHINAKIALEKFK